MDQKLKVSIIMNCFNGEQFLSEAIKSVLDQTYRNWELIFWDNQSIDNSKKIFKSFKDKRLKYYFSKKKTTLHLARNLALKKSNGDLISFLDVDDYWYKDKLFLQVKELKEKNFSCVYSKYDIKYENLFFKRTINKNKLLPEGNIFKKILKNYDIAFCTLLIKKKKLINFPKVFNTKYDLISDYDFILKFAKNNYFSCVQKPLVVYRKHKRSMSLLNLEKQVFQMKSWLLLEKKKNFFSSRELFKIQERIEDLNFKLFVKKISFNKVIILLTSNLYFKKKIQLLKYFLFKNI